MLRFSIDAGNLIGIEIDGELLGFGSMTTASKFATRAQHDAGALGTAISPNSLRKRFANSSWFMVAYFLPSW